MLTKTPPLAVGIDEAGAMIGVRRTSIYNLVRSGALPSLKIGSRHLIPVAAIEKFVQERTCIEAGSPS